MQHFFWARENKPGSLEGSGDHSCSKCCDDEEIERMTTHQELVVVLLVLVLVVQQLKRISILLLTQIYIYIIFKICIMYFALENNFNYFEI